MSSRIYGASIFICGLLLGTLALAGFQQVRQQEPPAAVRPNDIYKQKRDDSLPPYAKERYSLRASQHVVFVRRRTESEKRAFESHPPIIVYVAEQESVLWWSDSMRFRIKIEKGTPTQGWRPANASPTPKDCPPHPFYRKFEGKEEPARLISSGPAKPEAVGCTYPVTITDAGGKKIDPHIQFEHAE
jgi:hypothetical protein